MCEIEQGDSKKQLDKDSVETVKNKNVFEGTQDKALFRCVCVCLFVCACVCVCVREVFSRGRKRMLFPGVRVRVCGRVCGCVCGCVCA